MMRAKENAAGPGRCIWMPLFAALALVLASTLPGASGDARAATVEECTAEFEESPAHSGNCTLHRASPFLTDQCTISANCQYTTKGQTHTRFTELNLPLDDVDDLQNCSGTLALSC